MSDKQRIIDLQKQVRIARTALERIERGATPPDLIAEDALEEMLRLDKPTQRAPLEGILGWSKRP